jgi:hypothetical protein
MYMHNCIYKLDVIVKIPDRGIDKPEIQDLAGPTKPGIAGAPCRIRSILFVRDEKKLPRAPRVNPFARGLCT